MIIMWTERERSQEEVMGQDMRAWVAMEHESTCGSMSCAANMWR